MSTTSNPTVDLRLRNIEVGAAAEKTRAAPSIEDPARREAYTSRRYRLTFATERPGVSATFVVDIGWDGMHGETDCPVADLESIGKTLIKEFASTVAGA